MVDLVCVDPKRVHEIWPHVEAMLTRAVDHCGEWCLVQLRDEVHNGEQLLWITWDGTQIKAAATTKLIREGSDLICLAVACGGEDEDWQERFSAIEEYARDEGCVTARIQGRPGWARVFKRYKTQWVTLEKRLD